MPVVDEYLRLEMKITSIKTFLGDKDEMLWEMKMVNLVKDSDPFKAKFFVHGNLTLRDRYKAGGVVNLIIANDDLMRSNRLSTVGFNSADNKLVFWNPDDGYKKHTKLTINMMDNYDYSDSLKKIKKGIFSIRIE